MSSVAVVTHRPTSAHTTTRWQLSHTKSRAVVAIDTSCTAKKCCHAGTWTAQLSNLNTKPKVVRQLPCGYICLLVHLRRSLTAANSCHTLVKGFTQALLQGCRHNKSLQILHTVCTYRTQQNVTLLFAAVWHE
jgi:hypothetical protein